MNISGLYSSQPNYEEESKYQSNKEDYEPNQEHDVFFYKDPRTAKTYRIDILAINRNHLYRMDELKDYNLNRKALQENRYKVRVQEFIRNKQDVLGRSIFCHSIIRHQLEAFNVIHVKDGPLLNEILEPMQLTKKIEKDSLIRIKEMKTKIQDAASNAKPPPLPPRRKDLQEKVMQKIVQSKESESPSIKKIHSAPTSPRPPHSPPRPFHSAPQSPQHVKTHHPPLPIAKPLQGRPPPPPPRAPAAEQFKKVTQYKADCFANKREALELGQNSFPLPGLRGRYTVTTTHLSSLIPEQKKLLRDHVDKYFYEGLVRHPEKQVHLTMGYGLEDALSKVGIKTFHREAVMDIKLIEGIEKLEEKPIVTKPLLPQPKLDPLAEALKISAERRQKGKPPNQK